MELRHIRYFLAVAEELNFTRAAAKMGIGQPPLSQQIKDLEAEIGVQLFRRLAQGAELTAAGRAFLERVTSIPVYAESAIHAAQRAARGESGSLRVGFTASAAFNTVVPSAIRSFRRAYPDVELVLEEANTTRLVQGLTEGTLDAVFVRPDSPGIEGLSLRLLSEEPLLLVLPASHPAADHEHVELALLHDNPLVMFPRAIGPRLYDTVIDACKRAGFLPRLGQQAPQIGSVVNLVAAEMGFSMVPASMRQLQVSGVVYREVAGDAPMTSLALAYRKSETSPVLRNFVSRALS